MKAWHKLDIGDAQPCAICGGKATVQSRRQFQPWDRIFGPKKFRLICMPDNECVGHIGRWMLRLRFAIQAWNGAQWIKARELKEFEAQRELESD